LFGFGFPKIPVANGTTADHPPILSKIDRDILRFCLFLSECVELLKREAREPIGWRYNEGVRVEAIAQRLGHSASAVSVQLLVSAKCCENASPTK